MKLIVRIIAIIVGLLFIFSGLVKANDPSGLAYKMEEFFHVWGMDWASKFTFPMSLIMNVLEIAAGIALIIGWRPKFTTYGLLVLIVFFTFLTGYAVLSGKIKTCGCFGDCIPLTAMQSFIKDIILLILIVFLVFNYKKITPWFNAQTSFLVVVIGIFVCTFFQRYVLLHLPVVDCLPYAKNKELLKQMAPPLGSIPDSVAVQYVYTKDGKEVSFSSDNFPADFNDTTYIYKDRKDVLIRKGNAEPALHDFALFNAIGTDTTKQLLAVKSMKVLFFAKDFKAQTKWIDQIEKLVNVNPSAALSFFAITNEYEKLQAALALKKINIEVLKCDGTVMKTFLRTTSGIVFLNDDKVMAKFAESDFKKALNYIGEIK